MAAAEPKMQRVREELWTSFASLLRSYVAAHGLQHLGADGAHVEIGGSEIVLRRGQRVVELRVESATGEGSWRVSGMPGGRFTLKTDGDIQFADGQVEAMDMAAEQFARTLYASQ